MATRSWVERLLRLARIAAENQYVIDSQELKVDQRVFRLLLRETPADQVRHRIDAVFVHDSCADSHSARAFSISDLLQQASLLFLIDIVLAVVSHIHKGGIKFHKRIDRFVDMFDALAFYWRQ